MAPVLQRIRPGALRTPNGSQTARIGARRKPESVRAECVELLDSVHRARLKSYAEKLAAWEAARDLALVVVPRRRAEEVPVDDAAPASGVGC